VNRDDLDAAVLRRYSEGATRQVTELCCPTDYDSDLLAAIPADVINRDYGCGNPTRHLKSGDVVLDLGSGTGKICFIAAQVVGSSGRVVGVDRNDDMLGVARAAAPVVAERIGFDNVTFLKGRIEDLATDREAVGRWLADKPVSDEDGLAELERAMAEQRRVAPLVADDSIDVVVSNCVLNLVMPEAKRQLFAEIFRVLKRGGRAVISDIVSDEVVPEAMQADPDLWAGCISGAFQEHAFVEAFEAAGFYGVEILERSDEPWQVVDGIEFRSVTVRAWKGKQGACLEQNQAVIYNGPWKRVEDDDGHTLERGQPMAVCGKTYGIMTSAPYGESVTGVLPRTPVDASVAKPFACTGNRVRSPDETKGSDYHAFVEPEGECCEPGTCC
jgi:ubiquinone/menaquinone biosynthesis C-methylase UbiE